MSHRRNLLFTLTPLLWLACSSGNLTSGDATTDPVILPGESRVTNIDITDQGSLIHETRFSNDSDVAPTKKQNFKIEVSTSFVDFHEGKSQAASSASQSTYEGYSADMFQLKDKAARIQDHVKNKEFVLLVANSTLSPGASIIINDVTMPIKQYEQAFRSSPDPQRYTIESEELNQLKQLKIRINPKTIFSSNLTSSPTDCVVSNTPGPNNEYRNGALTIQAIDAEIYALDSIMKTAADNGGLLWESTVFFHSENPCSQFLPLLAEKS